MSKGKCGPWCLKHPLYEPLIFQRLQIASTYQIPNQNAVALPSPTGTAAQSAYNLPIFHTNTLAFPSRSNRSTTGTADFLLNSTTSINFQPSSPRLPCRTARQKEDVTSIGFQTGNEGRMYKSGHYQTEETEFWREEDREGQVE
jgi:hypothetical protein